MPRNDRTGPMGAGPGTGWGLGYCGGDEAPGFGNPRFGPVMAWGHGLGWRHRFFAAGQIGWGYPRCVPPTHEKTLQALKAEADWLKA